MDLGVSRFPQKSPLNDDATVEYFNELLQCVPIVNDVQLFYR